MKLLFLLLCQAAAVCVCAQNYQLENTWAKNSRTVYIGLNNCFRINGDLQAVKNVSATNAGLKRVAGNVYVLPTAPGEVVLTIAGASGDEHISLQAKKVPDFNPCVEDDQHIMHEEKISRVTLLHTARLLLVNKFSEVDSLAGGAEVTNFTIVLNGHDYAVNGALFPPEVLLAIQHSSPGDKLEIKNIEALVPGLRMRMSWDKRFSYEIM